MNPTHDKQGRPARFTVRQGPSDFQVIDTRTGAVEAMHANRVRAQATAAALTSADWAETERVRQINARTCAQLHAGGHPGPWFTPVTA